MPKITQYPQQTVMAADDQLIIVDTSTGTTKRVTLTDLINTVNGLIKPQALNQSVADQAARDAIASPFDGLLVYRKDLDAVEIFDGTNWNTYATKKPISSFRVERTTAQTLTSGVGNKVAFATEDHDVGNNFDTSTSVFTAAVAGSYHFEAQIQVDATGNTLWCLLYKNATVVAKDTRWNNTAADDMSAGVSATIELDVGDTVEVQALHDAGSNRTLLGTNVGCNYFSGFFVGKVS